MVQREFVKPKLGAVIAEAIEAEIIGSGWPVGSVLATEAQLIERFGVSRATVREAIGQLERRGIAAMRAGKNGGLIVSAPAHAATVRALATYLELADVSVEDILAVRIMLEQQAALLAAERITDDEARALREEAKKLNVQGGALEDQIVVHAEIRRLIALASHNPVLVLFTEALSISVLDVVRAHMEDTEGLREVIARAGRLKQQLVEAVVGFNKFEAQRLTREDGAAQVQGFRDLRVSHLAIPATDWNSAPLKLPQMVALKISRKIADNHLLEGEKLGSEPDLQEQLGVSRSVLREAIRMLESYSVVRMRRGSGGGLLVGRADPGPTISSAVRFLRSMDVAWSDLFEIREVLEPWAVELAANNVSAEQRERLLKALEAEAAVRPDEDDPLPVMTALHKMIPEASGNNVLALVMKLVVDTTAASYAPTTLQVYARISKSHRAIITAILENDPSMARRRIFDHLIYLGTIGSDLSPPKDESWIPASLRDVQP